MLVALLPPNPDDRRTVPLKFTRGNGAKGAGGAAAVIAGTAAAAGTAGPGAAAGGRVGNKVADAAGVTDDKAGRDEGATAANGAVSVGTEATGLAGSAVLIVELVIGTVAGLGCLSAATCAVNAASKGCVISPRRSKVWRCAITGCAWPPLQSQ